MIQIYSFALRPATCQRSARRFVALLERHAALIFKTVLLETECVLRSRYGYKFRQVAEFFNYLSALPSVTLEDREAVRWALEALARGIDFADALHVASAGGLALVTLDRKLQRKASRIKGAKVQLLKVPGS
ncbi:MAG: PIN domain-containing protein [Burkholderiales bacterium]